MPVNKKSYTEEEKKFIKSIGFKVQFFRKRLNLSQLELAERADLSYTTISHLESTNVHGISIVSLHRLAKALDVEPYQLLKFD